MQGIASAIKSMPIYYAHAMRQFSALHFFMWSAATCRIAVPVVQSLSSPLKYKSQNDFTFPNCDSVMPHSWQMPFSAAVPWNVCLIANSRTSASTLCRNQVSIRAQISRMAYRMIVYLQHNVSTDFQAVK